MLNQLQPAPIRANELDHFADAGIKHGFFTREGGVSEGIYRGLNVGLGSGDERSSVEENRRRAARWLGIRREGLATLHQVHSPEVVVVREAPPQDARPQADALVTDRPGIALGILTADCGPVLFADPRARIVGAAHAGWKGALTGVLEATIEAMEGLGGRREDMLAVLGPSISGAAYEVGPEFVARFVADDVGNEAWFSPATTEGHSMFDLPGYTIHRLRAARVGASHLNRCTYSEEALFFSYRRATHRNEKDYGRQISAIILEDR